MGLLIRNGLDKGPLGKVVLENEDMLVPTTHFGQVHDINTDDLKWPAHLDRL